MRAMTKEDFFKAFKNQSHIEQLKEIPQKFNVIHNEEKKTTNITIYGVIGSWWNGITEKEIDTALNEAGDNDVIINLSSPGGDAFQGISIFNRLRRHSGKITIHVDGWACSAASVIMMAGDEVIMELGSMAMIHEASSFVWGTKTEMRKESDVLEELEEGIIDIYMTKANVDREEIRQKVDAETWFSAKKAVEIGFATKVVGADETEDDEEDTTTMSVDEKQKILNELKNTLKPNQEPVPSPSTSIVDDKGNGSFNLLKKWR